MGAVQAAMPNSCARQASPDSYCGYCPVTWQEARYRQGPRKVGYCTLHALGSACAGYNLEGCLLPFA